MKNVIEKDLDIQGGFIQKFEIGPKMSFKIYNVAGPYIDAKLTEKFSLCANSNNFGRFNWKGDFDIGAKITAGVEAGIKGLFTFDYSKTWKGNFYSVQFPYQLEAISGNRQQYSDTSPLINPIKVRVMSNKGFSVPGVTVKFEADPSTTGIVIRTYVVTDINGYAQTDWTPTNANFSKLIVTVQDCNQNNISNSPLIFEATEAQMIDCTRTSLYADYTIANNVLTPVASMGIPPYEYSTDGTNFSTTIPEITLVNGENYSIAIKDANGCLAFTNYYKKPFSCNDYRLNVGLSVYGKNISAKGKGGKPPYQYAIDASTTYGRAKVFYNLPNGRHSISIKDANNCTQTNSIKITNSTNNLVAYFSIEGNKHYHRGQTIKFKNLSNNAFSYSWDFGDDTSSTTANPTHFYSSIGDYTIVLTVTNSTGERHTVSKNIAISRAGTTSQTYPTLIAVTGGTFTMGRRSGLGDGDELPTHSVTLSDYSIGQTEVTVAQYRLYTIETAGVNMPPYILRWGWNDNDPMVSVGWNDAKAYCTWLSGKLNKTITLPTEAQWEFAARGGNKSNGYTYSGSNTLSTVAWYEENSGKAHEVAQKNANELGLYDMSGNVWEWCSDWYDSNYYNNRPNRNPQGALTGSYKVLRGGSWGNDAYICRVARRFSYSPGIRGSYGGFRVVSL